jgi:DNA-binding CsgD family transcriptional regulator
VLHAQPLHELRVRTDAGVVIEAARRRRLAPRGAVGDEAVIACVEPDTAARAHEREEARTCDVRPAVAVRSLELRRIPEDERLVVRDRRHLVPERLGDVGVVLEEEDVGHAVPRAVQEVREGAPVEADVLTLDRPQPEGIAGPIRDDDDVVAGLDCAQALVEGSRVVPAARADLHAPSSNLPGVGPVGRDGELARVEEFLVAATIGLRALAIVGPAGIGKTEVWAEGMRRAREEGTLVLSARPSESERGLSFTGLSDLLDGVDVAGAESLTAAQGRALDVALLRADAGETAVDGRAVATGLLGVLRALARDRPLVIAVDDAQWLDAASAEALAFSARRLEELAVGILVSVRVDGGRPGTFERSVPAALRSDLTLGPLRVAALHLILRRHLGVVFPRPVLVRVVTACDGNPFYALEIARELAHRGVPADGRLPIPQELQTLVHARLARLPARTREALLVASCLSRPTAALVDLEALAPAEEAGVVQVDAEGRIRFSHPLIASAVYDAAPAGKKRRLHRELAQRIDDPEERARHLSLVTDEPDEAVAAALDRAVAHAAARGASAAAAELARRALELSVDRRSETGTRRALTLAHHLLDAGDTPGATALLDATDGPWLDGDPRAEVLQVLGQILWYEHEFDRAYAKLVDALEHAVNPELAARIHVEAAWIAHEGHPLPGIEHTDAALAILDADRNPGLYSRALLFGAYLRLVSGQGADDAAYERGAELQRQNVEWDDTSPVWGMWPLLKDEFATSRSLYEWGLGRSRAEGDETSVQGSLVRLTEIACWTGNWEDADRYAAEGAELAERLGTTAFLGSALYARGLIDAHLGRVDEARAAGTRVVELFADRDQQRALGHWVLGFLELSFGRPDQAAAQYSRAAAIVDRLGQQDPARFRFHPDQIEAAILQGDLDSAEALLDALDARARSFPRPWILATGARCRALLLAARGDLTGAEAAARLALEHHERLEMPFEHARTLLVEGVLLRRLKRKRLARASLEEAHAIFVQLGASLWTQRAQEELRRVVVRRAPEELTATELRIARLAADGLTNRAIADQAFVSVKTVETNLKRAYGKLGISSRAQLARALDRSAAAPAD